MARTTLRQGKAACPAWLSVGGAECAVGFAQPEALQKVPSGIRQNRGYAQSFRNATAFFWNAVTAMLLPGEMDGALPEDSWIVSPSQAGYRATLRRTARPRCSRWPNQLSVSYRGTVFPSLQSARPFGLDDGPRCGCRVRQTPGSAGQDFFLPLLQRCWAGYHHGALQEAHCLGLWVKRGSH